MRFEKKYAPKRMVEVLSQPEAIGQMLLWLSGWRKGRPLIIHGPTGSGKSAAVRALALDRGLELLEIGGEDSDASRILPVIKQQSLLRKKRLVLVEDPEHIPAKLLSSVVKESIFPVIIFVDDVWKPKFAALRAASEVLQFKKVPRLRIEKILEGVGKSENLPEAKFRSFAESAGGDVRAALIDIESGSDAARDRKGNVFDTLKIVFRGPSKEALAALSKCDKDPSQIFWWVEENITNEFSDPRERAEAFELLSLADLRKKRCPDILASLSSVRKGKAKAYVSYRPPRFNRSSGDELAMKLALATHCSVATARMEMEYLKSIVR